MKPSEFEYDVPPGYSHNPTATTRTRLVLTGDQAGSLDPDAIDPAAWHGSETPDLTPAPDRPAHTPPRIT